MTAPDLLVWPMLAHVAWASMLYAALTLVRAPDVWGIGRRADGGNPWAIYESRVSANLSNQFEWPVLFYAACLYQTFAAELIAVSVVWLAWVFIGGRVAHSAVQILTGNVRLRGLVFTINFVAVLGMWWVIGRSVI